MLHLITSLQDPWIHLLKDDPVRPSIPTASRVHDHATIFVLVSDANEPQAVTCVAYLEQVPTTEGELGKTGHNVAAFYTIWSYSAGAGRTLIREAQAWIKQNTEVKRYVTLSPKTEMARKFHINNGAVTLQENPETVNYEYPA